jgi:hypothetical protein
VDPCCGVRCVSYPGVYTNRAWGWARAHLCVCAGGCNGWGWHPDPAGPGVLHNHPSPGPQMWPRARHGHPATWAAPRLEIECVSGARGVFLTDRREDMSRAVDRGRVRRRTLAVGTGTDSEFSPEHSCSDDSFIVDDDASQDSSSGKSTDSRPFRRLRARARERAKAHARSRGRTGTRPPPGAQGKVGHRTRSPSNDRGRERDRDRDRDRRRPLGLKYGASVPGQRSSSDVDSDRDGKFLRSVVARRISDPSMFKAGAGAGAAAPVASPAQKDVRSKLRLRNITVRNYDETSTGDKDGGAKGGDDDDDDEPQFELCLSPSAAAAAASPSLPPPPVGARVPQSGSSPAGVPVPTPVSGPRAPNPKAKPKSSKPESKSKSKSRSKSKSNHDLEPDPDSAEDSDDMSDKSRLHAAARFRHSWDTAPLITAATNRDLWAQAAMGAESAFDPATVQFFAREMEAALASVARAKAWAEAGQHNSGPVRPTLLLLKGPPGTGKSEAIKLALASLVDGAQEHLGALMVVALSQLTPKWQGSNITDIENAMFLAANPAGCGVPFTGISVVVIDELGSFVDRSDGNDPNGLAVLRDTVIEILTRDLPLHFAGAMLVIGTVNDGGRIAPAVTSRARSVVVGRPNLVRFTAAASTVLVTAVKKALPGVPQQALVEPVARIMADPEVATATESLWRAASGDLRPLVQAADAATNAAAAAASLCGAAGAGTASTPVSGGAPGGSKGAIVTTAGAVAEVFRREAATVAALAQLQREVAAAGGDQATTQAAALMQEVISTRVPTASVFAAALRDVTASRIASAAYDVDKRAWG